MNTSQVVLVTSLALAALAPAIADTPPAAAATPPAIPKGCEPYTGPYAPNGGLKCVVTQGGIQSWSSKDPGKWYPLVSTAPTGYVLRYSEGHVRADNPHGDKKPHECGVRDSGGILPYDPPSPYNDSHQRAGEAHWAECIIVASTPQRVEMKFNIQGVEAKNVLGVFGTGDGPNTDQPLIGTASITAIYVPTAAAPAK